MFRLARKTAPLLVTIILLGLCTFLVIKEDAEFFFHNIPTNGCYKERAVTSSSDTGEFESIEAHIFHKDGLLEVNSGGRHPIHDLISEAKIRWKEKNERQSQTLREAVEEYKRRYNRLPPKGFDKWWDYVVKHNVPLPDEYDQINRDLEPFYGMNPSTLVTEQQRIEGTLFTFTLVNSASGELTAESINVTSPGDARKAEPQIGFLKDVSKDIPPFRATFSVHDGSSKNMYWHLKQHLIDAAREGKYFDPLSLPDPRTFGFHWNAICAPGSPIMSYLTDAKPFTSPSTSKKFIHDHLPTMDPCYHPQHTFQVGFLHSRREGPLRLPPPLFALSKSTIHTEILAIPAEQVFLSIGQDLEWEEKEDERLFWRGSNTGLGFRYDDCDPEGKKPEKDRVLWRHSQRLRLIDLCSSTRGKTKVLQPPIHENETLKEMEISLAKMNPAFMDVAFTDKPVQCDQKMCAVLAREYDFRKRISQTDANRYKYFIDIDGNGWSGRFRKLMQTNSLVMKATVFPEWFTDRIQPWVHYAPLQIDYSDLYDTLTFFRGDLAGNNAHDATAKDIAYAGKEWVKTHWREEDMTAYLFRLMLEYSRVMSLDREASSFKI